MTMMMGSIVCLWLVAGLDAPPGSHSPPREAVATRPAPTPELEVETIAAGSAGEAIRGRIEEQATTAFGQAGWPERGLDPSGLRVVVRVEETQGEAPGFRYDVRIEHHGTAIAAGAWQEGCPLCTETELIGKLESTLAAVTARIETLLTTKPSDLAAPPSVSTQGAPVPPPRFEAKPPDSRTAKPRPRLEPMTIAGISVMSVGAIGTAVGLALAFVQPREIQSDPLNEIETQTAAYVLLPLSGAALIVGATLIGVGQTRGSRRKAGRALAFRF